MSHTHPARPDFGPEIPEVFHAGLHAWASSHVPGNYTNEEMKLFRSMALAYADPTRPTMRELYAEACEMLDEDEKRSGIKTPKPSASMFRKLILSLPSEYIDAMRYGTHRSRYAKLKTAAPFVDGSQK